MRPSLKQMLAPLLPDPATADGRTMLDALLDRGLIDERAAERLFAQAEVMRMVKRGHARMKAMSYVADKLCCSFHKVRKMIYNENIHH